MVAAKDNGHGAPIENGFHGGCRSGAVPRVVPRHHRDIAAIDNADATAGENV
jgi:hypothetical protein